MEGRDKEGEERRGGTRMKRRKGWRKRRRRRRRRRKKKKKEARKQTIRDEGRERGRKYMFSNNIGAGDHHKKTYRSHSCVKKSHCRKMDK